MIRFPNVAFIILSIVAVNSLGENYVYLYVDFVAPFVNMYHHCIAGSGMPRGSIVSTFSKLFLYLLYPKRWIPN